MSQSGLSRLCGVRPHTINQLIKSVITSSCKDFLKPLQGEELTLPNSYHEFKNVTILRDTVCAHILEWYAFESQRPNETAKQAFRKFASMGIRTWIQGITGWEKGTEALVLEPQPEEAKPDLGKIATELEQLEHSLLVALKHRHAIHNVVEQPTVVDLSLQQIIHTAVHVQAKTLNGALKQVALLRHWLTDFDLSSFMDEQQINQSNDFWQQVGALRAENEALVRRLAILQGQRSTLGYTSPEEAKMNLEERIEWLTQALLAKQKRPNNDRAQKICQLQATILARYEAGESLKAIAQELELGYETVKTYLKRVRTALRPELVLS